MRENYWLGERQRQRHRSQRHPSATRGNGWDFSDFVLGDFSVFQRKESDDGMIKINYFDERELLVRREIIIIFLPATLSLMGRKYRKGSRYYQFVCFNP